jgi:uncharacterized protein YfaS (alpha-2-macroglobulin family)
MFITGKDLQFALVAMNDASHYYWQKAEEYKKQKGLKGKKINPNFDEALGNNEITEISYATNNIVFENQDKVVFATKEYFIEFNKKQKSNYDYRLV